MKRLKEGTVRKVSGTPFWIVDESFFWLVNFTDKEQWMIIAEEGFKTNYGSIPRILRPIYDPTKYNSYVIHDAGYTFKRLYSSTLDCYTPMTRKEVDDALLEGLKYEGAGFLERFFIYLGVRIGGWIAW